MSVDEQQRLKRAVNVLRENFSLGWSEMTNAERESHYLEAARHVVEAYIAPEPPPYPTDAMLDVYERSLGRDPSRTHWRESRRKALAAAIAADTSRQAIIDAAVALASYWRDNSLLTFLGPDAKHLLDAVNEARL